VGGAELLRVVQLVVQEIDANNGARSRQAHPWMTFKPTPPQPITTALLPGSTLAVLIAAHASHDPTADQAGLIERDIVGNRIHVISGTTTYWAKLASPRVER